MVFEVKLLVLVSFDQLLPNVCCTRHIFQFYIIRKWMGICRRDIFNLRMLSLHYKYIYLCNYCLSLLMARCSSIQHDMHVKIKFVSDLRQIGDFARVLRFPQPIKLSTTILLKEALNTITLTPLQYTSSVYPTLVSSKFSYIQSLNKYSILLEMKSEETLFAFQIILCSFYRWSIPPKYKNVDIKFGAHDAFLE